MRLLSVLPCCNISAVPKILMGPTSASRTTSSSRVVKDPEGVVIADGNTTACKAQWPFLADGYAVTQGHYDTVNMVGTVDQFLMSQKVTMAPIGIEGGYWFMTGDGTDFGELQDLGVRRISFYFPDSKDLTQWVTYAILGAEFLDPPTSMCVFSSADVPALKHYLAAEKAKAGL
ncbi:unnamed protein product [Symbiodinium sp. CCMP2456]|nr:unnamed protein product [Symbiodinium sp. CCMP2456]